MKQHQIRRLACEGRLFVLSCRCTFDTEQLKVGQTYGSHVLRESIMCVTISAVLCCMSSAPAATHIRLLTASYIKLTTSRRAACSLRHSISSFTDTVGNDAFAAWVKNGFDVAPLPNAIFFFPGSIFERRSRGSL